MWLTRKGFAIPGRGQHASPFAALLLPPLDCSARVEHEPGGLDTSRIGNPIPRSERQSKVPLGNPVSPVSSHAAPTTAWPSTSRLGSWPFCHARAVPVFVLAAPFGRAIYHRTPTRVRHGPKPCHGWVRGECANSNFVCRSVHRELSYPDRRVVSLSTTVIPQSAAPASDSDRPFALV